VGADWARLLPQLAEQLRTGRLARERWHHPRLYTAAEAVLEAIDAAHPGGLDDLRRRRRR
jgi:hypothetical protein